MEFIIAVGIVTFIGLFSGPVKEKPKDPHYKTIKTCQVKHYKKDCTWRRIK